VELGGTGRVGLANVVQPDGNGEEEQVDDRTFERFKVRDPSLIPSLIASPTPIEKSAKGD